jgi:DNA-binding NarL/FixJ family response regulator
VRLALSGTDVVIAADVPASPRVLIVEDEYLLALQSEMSLRDAGYEVIGIAVTALEAVELARSQRPDLVIMDVRLSGDRDGIDAAIEIHRKVGIRCVFATAHGDAETLRRAEAAAPIGWIAKPYTAEQLVASMVKALSNKR